MLWQLSLPGFSSYIPWSAIPDPVQHSSNCFHSILRIFFHPTRCLTEMLTIYWSGAMCPKRLPAFSLLSFFYADLGYHIGCENFFFFVGSYVLGNDILMLDFFIVEFTTDLWPTAPMSALELWAFSFLSVVPVLYLRRCFHRVARMNLPLPCIFCIFITLIVRVSGGNVRTIGDLSSATVACPE